MPDDLIIDRILRSVIPVLIVVIIGYIYGRWRRPDISVINKLCMELLVPILIFSVLAGKNVQLEEYVILAIGVACIILGCGLITWLLCLFFKIEPKTFVPPMMFTNTGNLAFPLVLLAFGQDAMPAIVIVFIVSQFLHFSLGFYILDSQAKIINPISAPTVFATIAGIMVVLTPVELNETILIPLDFLANTGVTLVLFALGIRMNSVSTRDLKIAVLGAIWCPLVSLVIAFLLKPLLNLNPIQWSVFLLFAALPPAVLCFMLAEQYKQEPTRVASIVLIGNIAAIVWIPLALALAPPI
ncbi:MAG: AEC family transporter [Oceanospirillales bacterium TMED33]|nr:transporter [Gammaproteobacteria bacterium]RPG20014.1 MAG: AEC family transporter [Oceanospirillales bacterium TMED33]